MGWQLLKDLLWLILSLFRSQRSLTSEDLFLRRQLGLYQERGIKPSHVDLATRIALTVLSRFFDWRSALVVVRPDTLVRWHRGGWHLFWRLRSKPDRPPIPVELQRLIRRMASENPIWGEERIANELLVKLGIRVSPRTVRKYMPPRPAGLPSGDQRWPTFLRNHAQATIACDFAVTVTATFKKLDVFVVIHQASRRLVRVNLTQHPTAAWTLQQLREAVGPTSYRYLLHDRDRIFSAHLDQSIKGFGMKVLKSPVEAPKANAICERS